MNQYPRLNDLRKKEAEQAVEIATSKGKNSQSIAANPLAVKKIKRQRNRKTITKVMILVVAVLIVGTTIFGARLLTTGAGFGGNNAGGFFGQLTSLFGSGQPLEGEQNDEVNFLLLGIGGEGHDGPNLSDTIVVASIKPSTRDVSMVSIPRDFLVEVPGYGYTKLNSAFALGEESGITGGGAELARRTIEPIVGLELPYYVVADFDGFKKIVDDLGGIDVDVKRDFYDNHNGIAYESGANHFGGEEALYFVRARYANGPEGSDFARASRTQQALTALRDKALQLNLVADFGKISGILNSVGEHVRTNLNVGEMRRVYELTGDISLDKIQSKVIDDGETGLLYSDQQPIGGMNVFVLRPNDSTYQEIQEYVSNRFEPAPPEPEDATLEVQNGTETVGVAGGFSNTFDLDIQILGVDNAKQSDYQSTFIVDNTNGEVPIALGLLQQHLSDLGLSNVPVVSDERYSNFSAADLILVLGHDYLDIN